MTKRITVQNQIDIIFWHMVITAIDMFSLQRTTFFCHSYFFSAQQHPQELKKVNCAKKYNFQCKTYFIL